MDAKLLDEVHQEAFDMLRRAFFDGPPIWYNTDGDIEYEGEDVERAFIHVLGEVAIALGVQYDPTSLRVE